MTGLDDMGADRRDGWISITKIGGWIVGVVGTIAASLSVLAVNAVLSRIDSLNEKSDKQTERSEKLSADLAVMTATTKLRTEITDEQFSRRIGRVESSLDEMRRKMDELLSRLVDSPAPAGRQR